MSSRTVVPGVYDQVVSEALGSVLDELGSELRAFREDLGTDRETAAHALARLVHARRPYGLRVLPYGLRVLTTACMGATERLALDALAGLGARVRGVTRLRRRGCPPRQCRAPPRFEGDRPRAVRRLEVVATS